MHAGTESGLNDSEGEADTSLISLLFFLVACVWYRQFGLSLPKGFKMPQQTQTDPLSSHMLFFDGPRLWLLRYQHTSPFHMFIKFSATYVVHKCIVQSAQK